jgi:hypothetical protein
MKKKIEKARGCNTTDTPLEKVKKKIFF